MKNEELKAEAIEREWIKAVGEKAYKTIKQYIDSEGFMDYDGRGELNVADLFECTDVLKPGGSSDQDTDFYLVRPKSLSGIEDNRGWVRILPDGSNLPDEMDVSKLYLRGKLRESGEFLEFPDKNLAGSVAYHFKHNSITHFREVEQYKQPIY
jgi:hypothetical protein